MRDCLLFEDEGRLVLLAGVAPEWFRDPAGIRLENLQTHFGSLSLSWKPKGTRATMRISGAVAPPGGFFLRLPPSLAAQVLVEGRSVPADARGDYRLASGLGEIVIVFAQ
jgi:hypothetical protein